MVTGDTTARGLLGFSEAYWRAGLALLSAKTSAMEHHAPVRFLLKHSIELSFKAYLRQAGEDDKQLRSYGHLTVGAAKAAIAKGLVMDQHDLTIIFDLLSQEDPMDDRYLRVGARQELKPEVLAQIAERLIEASGDNIKVLEMMASAGGAVGTQGDA